MELNCEVVVGMIERGGRTYLKHVPDTGRKTLLDQIQKTVSTNARLITDQNPSYKYLSRLGYAHQSVNHSEKEFVRGDIHTNSIEGIWSHLKKGIAAVYIQVSKKHLNKYCDEYSFRFSTRKLTDFERFAYWFDYCVNKRLKYGALIRNG